MTHPPDHIERVLELGRAGESATEISRSLRLPRETVRDWLTGRLPRAPARAGCEDCGGVSHPFGDLPASYVYLLGLYLGDGCVSAHPRGVHRLRITLDLRYPGIVRECERAMRDVLPRDQRVAVVPRKGCCDVSSYWKGWPCVLPQVGAGKKHERPIVLTPWQERLVDRHPDALLRGLIHSDGCRFMNTGTNWVHPRYSFSNRSEDIRGIFCDACARLGLRWTTAPHTVYVSRKADVAVLDEFIGPKA